tara:strand:+ start:182803 stop:183411 length:609 start_codon:yes stop_codon:yes gene_type:complete
MRLFILFTVIALTLLPSMSFALAVPSAPSSSSDVQILRESAGAIDYYTAILYCDIRDVINGTMGTLVGLLISIAGGYSYLIHRKGYGLFFFFAGVLLTGLPGIFSWYYEGMVTAFGSYDGNSVLGVTDKKETLESWCAGVGAHQGTGDKASGSTIKDEDVNAMKGVGLKSLEFDDDSYCFSPIKLKDDGSYDGLISTPNCVK